jgi:hypothetical protein
MTTPLIAISQLHAANTFSFDTSHPANGIENSRPFQQQP